MSTTTATTTTTPRPVAAPAPTPKEATVPFTTTKNKDVPSIKDVQGAAWSMRSSKSFCIDDIAIRLSVARDDKDAMKAVQNRVMQLCASGRLIRLKRGTYAYPQEPSAIAAATPAAPEPTTIAYFAVAPCLVTDRRRQRKC